MQEEGMHMRFLSGWRLPVLVAAIASLLILPFITATLADPTAPGKPARVTEEQGDLNELPIEQKVFFARSSYVWEYATGPYYGKVDPSMSRTAGTLVTPVGSFRLTEGELPFPQQLRTVNRLSALGDQYFIVQFAPDAGGVDLLRQLLAKHDRTTVASMPVAAHVAKLNAELLEDVQKLPGVIAIEPYHAALKFSPSLGRVPLADAERAISSVYELAIGTWRGEDPQPVVDAIESMGGKVISVATTGTILAELHRSKLRDVSMLEAVSGISEYYDGQLRDEKTSTTMQTGAYNQGATPYHDAGVDGSGGGVTGVSYQIVAVIDSGIKLDAGDLSDTRTTSGTPGTDAGNADPSGEHRKVLLYETTDAFGGKGDLKGCDTVESGQFTHGHFVATTVMGNASVNLPGTYGAPYIAKDKSSPLDTKQWNYIGVAPGAKLVFYDAQRVPGNGTCDDPLLGSIDAPPGMLYGGTAGTGTLGTAYTSHGARTFNISWGANVNEYSFRAEEVDEFIFENPEAMVFLAVGNAGLDEDSNGIPDLGSLGEPATAKNGVAVGQGFAPNTLNTDGNTEFRSAVSSTGPEASSGRIAPQLMAPGTDVGASLGPATNYACKTGDDEQNDPVECDLLTGKVGTSVASGAAAGAAILARDYFAQGFYPQGVQLDANRVTSVSGALVKALLVASADFMNGQSGAGLFELYRVNNEQGWGRIQLDEVLPLGTWADAPKGLVVVDGFGNVPNLLLGAPAEITGTIDAINPGSQSATFEVCERDQELRVALVYTEAAGSLLNGTMVNDLDLRIESPSSKFYFGNYFTDDENRDRVIDLDTEDCPSVVGQIDGELDASQWSQPACEHACNATSSCPVGQEFSRFDPTNPIEMIALSPDYDGDGVTIDTDFDPDNDNQLEVGTWTVSVISNGGGNDASQDYALVIAGGICNGSSIGFDRPSYVCNEVFDAKAESPMLSVIDPAEPVSAIVAGDTLVEVFPAGGGAAVDAESGTAFGFGLKAGTTFKHQTDALTMTDGTVRVPGNGVLDVRDGDTLVATYTVGPVVRTSSAQVECGVRISSVGQIQFSQWGQDGALFINGGCERNGRGHQDTYLGGYLGAPDGYMDAGENIVLDFGFTSNEAETMTDAVADVRCVLPDGNSPADCTPDRSD
jgi:hypothetical protein